MALFGMECPYCGSKNVVKLGKICHKQRYRCQDCIKTFYAKWDYAPITKLRSKWFS